MRSLVSDAALRKTFALVAERGPGAETPEDFDALFAPLDADPLVALDAVYDRSNMLLDQEPEPVRADLRLFGTPSAQRRTCFRRPDRNATPAGALVDRVDRKFELNAAGDFELELVTDRARQPHQNFFDDREIFLMQRSRLEYKSPRCEATTLKPCGSTESMSTVATSLDRSTPILCSRPTGSVAIRSASRRLRSRDRTPLTATRCPPTTAGVCSAPARTQGSTSQWTGRADWRSLRLSIRWLRFRVNAVGRRDRTRRHQTNELCAQFCAHFVPRNGQLLHGRN